MEFRVSREARDRYHLRKRLFSTRKEARRADPADARRFARRLVQAGAARPDRPINAGEVGAMGLIHEVLHRAIERASSPGSGVLSDGVALLADELGRKRADGALAAFEAAFPGRAVYARDIDPRDYLRGATGGTSNRELTLEELLLLWVANQNPGFMRYGELFDDRPLADRSEYPRIVATLQGLAAQRAEEGEGEDLVERLLAPGRAAPDSLAGQLRWIADHWSDILDDDLRARLTLGLDVLAEEELAARRAWERAAGGPGGDADAAALHGFGGLREEPEAFSPDLDWMSRLVLLAKSTYVWLDQLSRAHGRPIRTLDAIPDAELDRMRDAGFTGLWLIGLWERSHASQRIKQLHGNPDAVASAYSLLDYRIADDLGGEAAWADLRDRAWARGIRLASDMVPNHMGIDSRWVMEHPGWFIGRDEPPFPAYTFSGPNLSSDERVGVYLEDHYADASDAAVVFKRVDRWSGATRYIYHGNDGTSFPWNDTAQLDFLQAEVREAVIRTILAVARRFPVIRFDAAMVLARKHVQRLWYPLPGHAGAIPSRAESALTQAQLDALMPVEFWREVVDRVAGEAPGTLLLAEAFWLLEGYFVRSLGMHRVYNSAFMHMLRDEKNADYRRVMRETLEFDARILGRYVNFMNNPDERTAVDQFGKEDKYIGVATLLATLPGLPMFGHGQLEGFTEKYGMEFRRAMLDETPDPDLLGRHERHIFPLLRERWRFAGAEQFRLLDATRGDGSLDEDVIAYANRVGEASSLIVYRNRFTEGRVRVAGVGPALGLPDDAAAWVILRDARSGLEHLRNGHDLHAASLELDLHAYQCHVFLDPAVADGGTSQDWARLAWRIGLGGVPDVRAALQEQLLEPVRAAVAGLLAPDLARHLAGAALVREEPIVTDLLGQALDPLPDALARVGAAAGGDGPALAEVAAARLQDRLAGLVGRVRAGGRTRGSSSERELATWLGSRRDRWAVLVGWAVAQAMAEVAGADSPEAAIGTFDAWGGSAAFDTLLVALEVTEERAHRAREMVRALLAVPPGELSTVAVIDDGATSLVVPSSWFHRQAVRDATGWNEWRGDTFVVAEAWQEWLDGLAARDAAEGDEGAPAAAAALSADLAAAGFRLGPPPIDPPADADVAQDLRPGDEPEDSRLPGFDEAMEPAPAAADQPRG